MWEKELNTAKCAALAAGQYLSENKNLSCQQGKIQARDVKLAADQEAEKIILDILSVMAPYPVLAEEGGEYGDLSNETPMWIVDPLDGTVNYSRGIPICCVSVALYRGWDPLLGVIFDFNRNELFTGISGEGGQCNGVSIRPSQIHDPAKAVMATGFPVNRDFGSDSLDAFVDNVRRFKKLRLLGSAALSLAYVACGRVDAYMEEDIMFYDIAAGVAIARAAGAWCEIVPTPRKKWSTFTRCAGQAGLFGKDQNGVTS